MSNLEKYTNSDLLKWEILKELPDNLILLDKEFNLADKNFYDSEIDNNIKEILTTIKNKSTSKCIYQTSEIEPITNINSKYSIYRIRQQDKGDRTEKIKNALLASEKEKTQILESITDCFYSIDLDCKIQKVNEKFKEEFPKYNENIPNQFCYKVIHNMTNPCIACPIKIVKRTKKQHKSTTFSKEGSSYSVNTYPLFDKNNNLTGAILNRRDISEFKNNERDLKKTIKVNKALADISRSILLTDLSKENIAKQILSTALTLTQSYSGFVSAKSENGNYFEWVTYENYSIKAGNKVTPSSITYTNENINEIIEKHSINKIETFPVENNSNSYKSSRINNLIVPTFHNEELIGHIYVSGNDSPYNEKDEKIIQQLSNIYSLSIYRARTEKELIKSKEKAEENDRLKSAFLANMSHEIRTPMNSINGFSELLKMTNPSEETRNEYLDIIYKSSNQLLSIINNILDVSKLEAKQLKLNELKYDINKLISNTISITAPEKLINKNLKIIKKLSLSDKDSTIIVDGSRLQQILTNLLNNAIKFTKKGCIELGYVLKNNMLEFYVKDSGKGIPKESRHIVFERFGQIDIGHTRKYEGTGLGLNICSGFVNLMGGEIWFESEVEKGSTFFFTIPYKKA